MEAMMGESFRPKQVKAMADVDLVKYAHERLGNSHKPRDTGFVVQMEELSRNWSGFHLSDGRRGWMEDVAVKLTPEEDRITQGWYDEWPSGNGGKS